MKVINTHFEGLKVIIPRVWEDDRGYFFESFNDKELIDHGIEASFVQDNEAYSTYGVIRGLHFQLPPYGQAKLVRVIKGEVLDIVVDLRDGSPTYGKQFSLILNDITRKQLMIPEGFAHGYAVLSDSAIFAYKCSNYYAPDYERGINVNDPSLNINWLIPDDQRIISSKDQALPPLDQSIKL